MNFPQKSTSLSVCLHSVYSSSVVARVKVPDIGEFVFWDLGGDAGFRPIWREYFVEADCVVFVIDSLAPTRFREAFDEIGERDVTQRQTAGVAGVVSSDDVASVFLSIHLYPSVHCLLSSTGYS